MLRTETLSGFYPNQPTTDEINTAIAVLQKRAAWFEHFIETTDEVIAVPGYCEMARYINTANDAVTDLESCVCTLENVLAATERKQ
jgi:hypothetical protein